MPDTSIPTITTPRLILRAFTAEDVDPMHRILGERDVLRYFPKTDPLSRDRVQKMVFRLLKHWEERGYGLWAVESRATGELMGRSGLQFLAEAEEVEVDFILGRALWGRGLATEAGRASLRYGFEKVGVGRVVGIRSQKNMRYKSVIVTKRGGPEVLQVIEHDLRAPSAGEARIKILATCVCLPDVKARYGHSPFAPKIPFVPGYAIIGVVDALGEGVTNAAVGDRVAALTVYGGYAEYIFLVEEQLIPVPTTLNPAEAVTLILNYIVAYQTLHRSAKVKAGDKVLIIGASGGIGTAFLQLGKLADLRMYGIASKSKHHILTEYGATPIDYHTQDFVEVIRKAEPDGLDAVFDGMGGDYFKRGFSVLRRGGTLVGYGNPLSSSRMLHLLGQVILFNLLPNGKSAEYYGTGASRLNRRPFLEDWATLFKLLEDGKIKPIIAEKFPILEAAQANALLESGQVIGNIILLAPELL